MANIGIFVTTTCFLLMENRQRQQRQTLKENKKEV